MKVRILPSDPGGGDGLQYLSSYVVDDWLCIDAGTIGISGTPVSQSSVRHIFITHSHIDHVASLPVFLENTYDTHDAAWETVTVYGHPVVLDTLQRHVFNGLIWPDFIRLSPPGRPFLEFCPLVEERPICVRNLRILPVAVEHGVKTFGYIVTDGASTVVFGADSGPTTRIWDLAREAPGPLSVFLEACFPNELAGLAAVSYHLTPALFAEEVRKIPSARTIIATHIKAKFRQKTVEELLALRIPELVIGEAEKDYEL